tara:strand:- start:2322 stop:2960 length:639 start_codon:yes stop_codon:yes gene_type:complete
MLESIHSFADEVVIVDGSSVDKTEAVVRAWADKYLSADVKYGICEWQDDFALQRNQSFKYCTGDWILRMDCDEVTSPNIRLGIKRMLSELPSTCLAVRIKQLNLYPNNEHYAADCGGWETWPRIFRNIEALEWTGRVHEHVALRSEDGELVDIPEQNTWDWHVSMIHRGWLEKARRQEREKLYITIPGSGFEKKGDLINRKYEVRSIPMEAL